VEVSPPSERPATDGGYDIGEPVCNGLGLDGEWEYWCLRQGTTGCKPDYALGRRCQGVDLLTIISEPTNLLASSSYAHGGTARWMSPELIDPEQFGFEKYRPTKASDCYALGMVIYETISGHLPFHDHTDLSVFVKVLRGERPRRGRGFANNLWEMLEFCWMPQPNVRPNIKDVLLCLERISNSSDPKLKSTPVDEGALSESNDDSSDEGTSSESDDDSSEIFLT